MLMPTLRLSWFGESVRQSPDSPATTRKQLQGLSWAGRKDAGRRECKNPCPSSLFKMCVCTDWDVRTLHLVLKKTDIRMRISAGIVRQRHNTRQRANFPNSCSDFRCSGRFGDSFFFCSPLIHICVVRFRVALFF